MDTFRDYALSFIGLPYKWGGDDPVEGFDCSGLIIELYKSVGILPRDYDGTAQSIYDLFEKQSLQNSYGLGSLVFYGESVTKITHVAMLIDNSQPWRIIEAGGGNSHVLNKEDAALKNAYVRIRPMNYRSDKVAVIKPIFFAAYP